MTRQHSVLTQELSDRELFEAATHVLPNLRAVSATHECVGPNWKTKAARHGVQLYEYDAFATSGLASRPRAMSSASALRFWPWSHLPAAREHGSAVFLDYPSSILTSSARDAASWPSANAGVSYAAVTFCELSCHVTEALDLLFSNDAAQFSASSSAIWGKKLRHCDQLRAAAFHLDARAASPPPSDRIHRRDLRELVNAAQPGHLGVNMYELAPKRDLHLAGRHSRAQQLCFTTYAQKAAVRNEATVVMRTLPKDVHDRLVDISEHSALRGALDHIAVGYHLTGHFSDVTGHRTRLAMCAYVSTFAGNEVPEVMHWRVGLRDAGDRANADAKRVVMLLARAACDFESVIQRRRLGQQPFLLPTPQRRGSLVEASCAVCERSFGLLRRRNQFCQLCGRHVCRRCSRKYEVESRAGDVRKHRVCHSCTSRVESSGGAAAEGTKSTVSTWYETTIVDVDDDCDDRYQCKPHGAFERTPALPVASPKPGHQLAEALFSPHPLDRARALEFLKKVVQQVTQETPRDGDAPLDPALVDKYLEARQRLTRMSSREFVGEDANSGRTFPVFYQQQPLGGGSSRSWVFVSSSSSSSSSSSDRHVFTTPAFDADADDGGGDGERDGLDAICEVAAQRLSCPMAFVSVVGRDEQHIVGAYEAPGCVYRLPRNQSIRSCGLLADGRPVIARHPTRDPRLCHLPLIRDAGVRFFAGFPVADRSGAVVASICAIDTLPRDGLSHDDRAAMAALAKLAADAFHDSSSHESMPLTP